MLALSLPVALIRARRSFRRPPVKTLDTHCPLLREARQLNRAGFPVAATLTTRVAIETELRRAAERYGMQAPFPSIAGLAIFLKRNGGMTNRIAKRLDDVAQKANKVAHGGSINRLRARKIIAAAGAVIVEMRKGVRS
jgi:hypothetical protein